MLEMPIYKELKNIKQKLILGMNKCLIQQAINGYFNLY